MEETDIVSHQANVKKKKKQKKKQQDTTSPPAEWLKLR